MITQTEKIYDLVREELSEMPEWNTLSEKRKFNFAVIVEKSREEFIKRLTDKNIVIYDLEIMNSPDDLGGDWKAFDRFGISCGVTYSYEEQLYKIWGHRNIHELAKYLNRADCVVGFNNLEFDSPLMKANGYPIMAKEYDIFKELKLVQKLKDGEEKRGGYGLNELGLLNLKMGKAGNGKNAVVLWKEEKLDELYTYCLHDVRLTKKIFDRIIRCEPIFAGRPPDFYKVRYDDQEQPKTLF